MSVTATWNDADWEVFCCCFISVTKECGVTNTENKIICSLPYFLFYITERLAYRNYWTPHISLIIFFGLIKIIYDYKGIVFFVLFLYYYAFLLFEYFCMWIEKKYISSKQVDGNNRPKQIAIDSFASSSTSCSVLCRCTISKY